MGRLFGPIFTELLGTDLIARGSHTKKEGCHVSLTVYDKITAAVPLKFQVAPHSADSTVPGTYLRPELN